MENKFIKYIHWYVKDCHVTNNLSMVYIFFKFKYDHVELNDKNTMDEYLNYQINIRQVSYDIIKHIIENHYKEEVTDKLYDTLLTELYTTTFTDTEDYVFQLSKPFRECKLSNEPKYPCIDIIKRSRNLYLLRYTEEY